MPIDLPTPKKTSAFLETVLIVIEFLKIPLYEIYTVLEAYITACFSRVDYLKSLRDSFFRWSPAQLRSWFTLCAASSFVLLTRAIN